MAILLKDLIEDRGKLELLRLPAQKCVLCDEQITFADWRMEEVEDFAEGKIHSGCRQAALGEIIEQNPIISPRIRRG